MHKKGFTLAEVLITLSIIGVVAALTVPTLVKNYEDTANAVKAKKVYSEIANAWKLYINDNGGSAQGTFANRNDLKNQFFKKYFNYVSDTESTRTFQTLQTSEGSTEAVDTTNTYTGIYRSDGVYIGIQVAHGECDLTGNSCAEIKFDVNGDKAPNRIGYDIFFVFLMAENALSYHPSYGTNESANQICIEPGHTGSSDWTNAGYGCLVRILQNQQKWSG